MKRTFKRTMMAIAAASVMAVVSLSSCSMGLAADETAVEEEADRVTGPKKNLTDSEKIDEIYKKTTAKKPTPYKGEKIAATRLASELTSKIPVDDIENPVAKYFAEAGIRALDKGMQALDHYLNDYTLGLYGVATDILWPEDNKVSKETQMILDKMDELEGQITDMSTEMGNGFDATKSIIMREADCKYLKERSDTLITLKNRYLDNKRVTDNLRGTGSDGLSFAAYQTLLAEITGKTDFSGSLEDVVSAAKSFFDTYSTGFGSGETYTDVCDRYAKAMSAWGFEYDKIMRSFAGEEVMRSSQLMTLMEAAYSPYFNLDINYNFRLQNLISFLKTTGSRLAENVGDLINGQVPAEKYGDYTFEFNGETVTPETVTAAKTDAKELYGYVMAYLCRKAAFFPENYAEVEMNGGSMSEVKGFGTASQKSAEGTRIANLTAYLNTVSSGIDQWDSVEESFGNYMAEVNRIYGMLANDRPGYVTCMIPGVEKTFYTTMGTVRYGENLKSFRGFRFADKGYVNAAFHGIDIEGTNSSSGASHWKGCVKDSLIRQYSGSVYSKDELKAVSGNTFKYLTSEEYKAVYSWYRNGNHTLYKSVPVTYVDSDGNVMKVERQASKESISDPTLTEIFFYGAGIGFSVTKSTVSEGNTQLTVYTPCEKAEADLGITSSNWDTGLTSKPEDTSDLFDVAVEYAYEDGAPTAEVADEHGGFCGIYENTIGNWSGKWEYRVLGHGIAGNRNGTWNNDRFKRANWLVTGIAAPKNKDTAEEVLSSAAWGADLHSDQTYVFPSVVHDVEWSTYWENH